MIEPSEKVQLFLDVMRDGTDEQVLEWRMREAETFCALLRGPAPGGGSPPQEDESQLRKALQHVADEIHGQVTAGTLRDAPIERRIYWTQVESLARDALAAGVARPGEDAPPALNPGGVVQQFTYLLNAMEQAAQEGNPAKAGYAAKRRAVMDFVASLARRAASESAK